MSATQNALLSRTRSARVPPGANSSRSLTSNGLGSSQTHATPTASNISLFLRNLRLLDLDHLPDWPDINALTFTNKDVAQGQKKRIQSVEWALYQLFALWDPDETRNKLQPFFPPADQLQSTNLRAALLRCLDQVKKNGVLGRDTVLRKTMLDECKGERLEEILAVFSSAVLKKMVAEEHLKSKEHAAIARNLALENRGYSGDRTELLPLILAHKLSLSQKLDQKKAARAQYKGFAELLHSKEREIVTRQQKIKAEGGQDPSLMLSEDGKKQVRRTVRNNWTGNERWMEALLYGDAKSRQDGLLTVSFDRVWRRVQTNRLEELQDDTGGLLEQLNGRFNAQKERLDKWQNFRKDMFGDLSSGPEKQSSTRVSRQKGVDLGFESHESIQPGRMSPKKLSRAKPTQLHGEYDTLLEDLDTELKQINHVPAARPLGRSGGHDQYTKSPTQSSCSDKPVEESVSELSELEEDLARQAAAASHQLQQQSLDGFAKPDAASAQPSKRPRPTLPQPLSSQHAFRPKLSPTEISPTESITPRLSSSRRSPVRQTTREMPSPVRPSTHTLPSSPQRRPRSRSPILRTQSPEVLSLSPTQQKADQILEFMDAASPSPLKESRPRHTLSLAERTRLSMVRGSSVDLDEDDELAMASPSPTRPRRRNTSSRSPTKRRPGTSPTAPEDAGDADAETDGITAEDDLVARTRRSMVNFEATQQKARLEKQRSLKRASKQSSGSISRQSYFPSREEEESTEKPVLEELIAEDGEGVDYEAVFKSRPKIKTSPPSRAAAIITTQLGFTYGTAVAGGPYYPSGALGVVKAAADQVAIQLEVVPEGALSATDTAAATAGALLDKYDGLQTVDDYTLLYNGEWTNTLPKGPVPGILSNYSQDLLFSMERLSNSPYAVRRLDPSVDNLAFGVDDAVAEQISGSTLQGLLDAGRLFYADHSAQGTLARTTGRYAPACDAYFYISEATGEFLPLAIRTGVGANLIYTPQDEDADWLLAKMMFNANDSWFVDWYHLASTHEVVQIVWLAAIRTLSVDHPVYALLNRLTYQVFAIQPIAASILFNPGGTVDQIFGYTGAAAQDFTTNLYFNGGAGNFQANYFLTNLQNRGLINSTFGPELTHFPFYEDASTIYTAIKGFMTTFVDSYYDSATDFQQDTELQAWAAEANGAAMIMGFPTSIASAETLIDILTQMAHLVSTAHHTSNTNDLLSLTGTLPLHPAALYQPLPTTKGNTSVVDFLPPLDKCVEQLAFSALFARPLLVNTSRSLLHMFDDPVLLAGLNAETAAAAATFQSSMQQFSEVVAAREFDDEGLSQGMPFVWQALDPNVAPYSITT